LQIAKRLMPDGRIMVNCGGSDTEESLSSPWVQNPTVKALCSAFPGQVWYHSSAIHVFGLQLLKTLISTASLLLVGDNFEAVIFEV
jgi:hypothetical protein